MSRVSPRSKTSNLKILTTVDQPPAQYAGDWNSNTSYQPGQIVTGPDGNTYMNVCYNNTSTPVPWTSGTVIGVPPGGTTNQALVKQSNADGALKWVLLVPPGGTTGQTLVKNSGTDFDTKWGAPAGGANITYKGDWSAGTYNDGDVVVYNGVSYMAAKTTTQTPSGWSGLSVPAPAVAPLGTTYGTTLPASPQDGQEHILVDSTTNPSYQWRFRFNAGSSSSYKWEFVGGAPARADTTNSETTTSTANVELTTQQRITLPRGGDYDVDIIASATSTVAGDTVTAVPAINAVGSGWGRGSVSITVPTANGLVETTSSGRIAGRTAGDIVMAVYNRGGTGTATFGAMRSLRVTPVRVS